MDLSGRQQKFTHMLATLILWVDTIPGYRIALGEVERPQEWQDIMVERGKSKTKNSKHCLNLAADVRLFKDDVYLTKSEDYKIIGDKWKELDPENVWGGDWEFKDGNHIQYGK